MKIRYRMRRLCAVAVGFVFFAAGVLKLMDPVGTSLIVEEYMKFLHLGFLVPAATVVAELFALAETVLGICLVTGVFRKFTAAAVSVLLGGFTVLTLILWIFNPPMDCGCFGEAVHLTHFQSFAKNVILCALAAYAFFPIGKSGTPKKRKYVTFGIVTASAAAFAAYSLLYIPMLELTPFNLSSRLYAATDESDFAENEYVSTFIYEKNGKKGVFTLDKLPDSTWTYVDTRVFLKQDHINETSHPQLSFSDAAGDSRDTLAVLDNVLVISVPRPERMSLKRWNNVLGTLNNASEAGFTSFVLAAASAEQFRDALEESGLTGDRMSELEGQTYFADYRTLISLNRSNAGATYFNNGTLIEKWAYRNLPGAEKLESIMRKDGTEVMLDAENRGRLWFQAFMLYSAALLLLL